MNRITDAATAPHAPQSTIPTALTSFIGRERDTTGVMRLLASSRFVTLTGAAGCGKTRLALRIATDVESQYADGVHWVELARLADPTLVPQAVARVLQVAEQPGQPIVTALLEALHDRYLLLVLDNCEHVLGACAELVETLLVASEVRMLATSREPLAVTGEMRYPVPPMELPPLALPADEVGRFDAIDLFVERGRAIVPGLALNSENSAVVASICRRLDGLPLAIELASARLNVLTVEQIAARLDDCFGLLGASPLTRTHHHTLRAAIDWSYDLLSSPEQAMLRRLSVFVGGCSLSTAEAVCVGSEVDHGRVLEILSSLVNKSLLEADTLRRGEARYTLLETIRQYADEKLDVAGEGSVIRDRHLRCFLQLTEETMSKLSGPYQQSWLDWLEAEYDNIRAALNWSLESNRIGTGLRIVIALYQFWIIRSYVEEGLTWLERLIAQVDDRIPLDLRANALAYASLLSGFRGNTTAQMAYGHEAAGIAETAGGEGKSALRWALAALAHAARAAGDYETEFALATRVIQLNRELGDTHQLSLNLSLYSPTALALGKYDEAHAMLDEGLVLLRRAGNPYRIAMALNYAGDLARCEQKYHRAQIAYEESIAMLRELGAERDVASLSHNLGHAYLHLGDVQRAHALFSESLALHQSERNRTGMAECLIGFAALAIVRGMPASGSRLLAAVVAIGGQQIASAWAATRMEYEYYLVLARASLTETAFQAEQAAGRALSLEQAMQYALNLPLNVTTAQDSRKRPDALTVREREVAVLIAQGRSNGEIADELFVSKRTVEKHIAHILSKLGSTNRAQIVRWAIEARLVKSPD